MKRRPGGFSSRSSPGFRSATSCRMLTVCPRISRLNSFRPSTAASRGMSSAAGKRRFSVDWMGLRCCGSSRRPLQSLDDSPVDFDRRALLDELHLQDELHAAPLLDHLTAEAGEWAVGDQRGASLLRDGPRQSPARRSSGVGGAHRARNGAVPGLRPGECWRPLAVGRLGPASLRCRSRTCSRRTAAGRRRRPSAGTSCALRRAADRTGSWPRTARVRGLFSIRGRVRITNH